MNATEPDLPSSDSTSLDLLHPTPEEIEAIWRVNGQSWAGRLPMEAYVRREKLLANQDFTRDGGITWWVLVDATKPPNARPILSSCESLKKRALVARSNGRVEDVLGHGIGSVFCDPRYRNRGYATRMIHELGEKLNTWLQLDGAKTEFSVLYSDIGKAYYARAGWRPFTSSHISLPPVIRPAKTGFVDVQPVLAEDLRELCRLDEQQLRRALQAHPAQSDTIRVSLIPNLENIAWHHAREEFAGQQLLGRVPKVKGAQAKCSTGDRVWCVWSRFFGNESTDADVLNILRLVVEGEEHLASTAKNDPLPPCRSETLVESRIEAIAAVLQAAQLEASAWGMHDVQLWSPTSSSVLAAQKLNPTSSVIHRGEDSIASLKWHGDNAEEASKVEWVGNEKYGWC